MSLKRPVFHLEAELQCTLHDSWRNGSCRADRCKREAGGIIIGSTKGWVIKRIEHLPTELNVVSFPDAPVLEDSQVSRVDPRRLEQVTRRGTKGPRRIGMKSSRIEILVQPS